MIKDYLQMFKFCSWEKQCQDIKRRLDKSLGYYTIVGVLYFKNEGIAPFDKYFVFNSWDKHSGFRPICKYTMVDDKIKQDYENYIIPLHRISNIF